MASNFGLIPTSTKLETSISTNGFSSSSRSFTLQSDTTIYFTREELGISVLNGPFLFSILSPSQPYFSYGTIMTINGSFDSRIIFIENSIDCFISDSNTLGITNNSDFFLTLNLKCTLL